MPDKSPIVPNVFRSKLNVPRGPANPVNTYFLQLKSTEGCLPCTVEEHYRLLKMIKSRRHSRSSLFSEMSVFIIDTFYAFHSSSPGLNSFKTASLLPSLLQPRVSHEDSLTYAELELVRPRPEPPASSAPDPAPSSPDTVYAQILFQEKQL